MSVAVPGPLSPLRMCDAPRSSAAAKRRPGSAPSAIQRKVLTPSTFRSRAELKECLLRIQDHYCAAARPFQWKFTREDRKTLLSNIQAHEKPFRKAV